VAKTAALAAHPRLRPWLARARAYRRQIALDRELRRMFVTLPEAVTDDQLSRLGQLWGDDAMADRVPYVRGCIAEAARSNGPILQCGGNLASILLGIICHQAQLPRKHLWVLEHDLHWAGVIRSWLERYEIGNAHVISAPAEQYDGFVWYVLDRKRLPAGFALVLCDASAALPSSARGVVERIHDRLDDRCVLLARNARRPRDIKSLSDWARTQRAPCVIQDAAEPYVKIALRAQRPDADHQQERLNTVYGRQAGH